MKQHITRRKWIGAALAVPVAAGVRAAALSGEKRRWDRAVPLGRSGVQVTPLGFGCESAHEVGVIRRAADLGITHFNSFPNRGDIGNFSVVGEALRPVRAQVTLATGSSRRTRGELLEDLDRQLLALRTDHVDLFYLLAVSQADHLKDELIEALQEARRAGKIRAGALSTHGFSAVLPRLLQVTEVIRALMVTCNFAAWDAGSWADAKPAIQRLREFGVGIVAMKALMGGMESPPEGRPSLAETLRTEPGRRTVLAAALRWVVYHELVDTVPAAAKNLDELEANCRAVAREPDAADHALLVADLERLGPHYCRLCPRCAAVCAWGLPIADLMRWLTYAEGYGDLDRARAEFSGLSPRLQRVRCGECLVCSARCPNGVQVRTGLTRAQTWWA